MRWVSYTRSISSRIGEENPANTIAEQNANIEQYLKNKGYRISEKYSDRKRSAEAADGFDRMVQDGMTQKFDAVAVDSIFRFGKTLPFQCKRKKGTTPCSYHTVPEKMLMMVAMKQIHHLVSTMCEEEKMVKEMLNNGGLDSTRSIKVKENSIAFRIQETEERRLRLYEDYKAEILDEEEYSRLKEHYIAEKQRLEHELQKQRQRSLELEKRMRICDEQMERMFMVFPL